MKILNIHGYGVSARNTAYAILDELYPGKVISPQIDYDTTPPDTVVSDVLSNVTSAIVWARDSVQEKQKV